MIMCLINFNNGFRYLLFWSSRRCLASSIVRGEVEVGVGFRFVLWLVFLGDI